MWTPVYVSERASWDHVIANCKRLWPVNTAGVAAGPPSISETRSGPQHSKKKLRPRGPESTRPRRNQGMGTLMESNSADSEDLLERARAGDREALTARATP